MQQQPSSTQDLPFLEHLRDAWSFLPDDVFDRVMGDVAQLRAQCPDPDGRLYGYVANYADRMLGNALLEVWTAANHWELERQERNPTAPGSSVSGEPTAPVVIAWGLTRTAADHLAANITQLLDDETAQPELPHPKKFLLTADPLIRTG